MTRSNRRLAALAALSVIGLPVMVQAVPTVVNFDIGDTTFTPLQRAANPGVLFVSNGSGGGALRLAPTVNSVNNTAAFDRTHVGNFGNTTIDFDFRIGGGNAADGIGFLLLATAAHGTTGAGPAFSEDPNVANAIGIGIDIFNNGGAETGNDVTLHLNGAQAAQTSFNPATQINLRNNVFNHLNATITPGGGGSTVAVTVTDGTDNSVHVVLPPTFVAGLNPFEARAAFAARTGGLNDNHDIDNLVINYGTPGTETIGTFDYGMTTKQSGTAPAANLVNIGGIHGNVLRLGTNVNSQLNQAAFDRSELGAFQQVHAEFDFRMGGGNGADGLAFALLNTANFGTTGSVVDFSEDPNLAGTFAVGLDIFNNGGAETGNDVSLHFNGAQLAQVSLNPGVLNLRNNVFNTFLMDLIPTGGGSLVTLSIIDGTDGIETPIFTDLFIAGLDPYEARAAFAARTGGLNDFHDIDNILVDFRAAVPEPASLSLIGMAALALLRRRRQA